MGSSESFRTFLLTDAPSSASHALVPGRDLENHALGLEPMTNLNDVPSVSIRYVGVS